MHTNDALAVEEAPPSRVPEITAADLATGALETRLAEIATFFDHAHAPYLEKADAALEYFNIKERLNFGQVVQNSGPGRPGIISQMARELPLPGKSEEARRKYLERALAIARIGTKVRSAAKKAGVARYQSTLLDIVKAGDEDDQLRKVEEFAARNRDRIAARKRDRKQRAAGQTLFEAIIRYPEDRKNEVLAALAAFAEKEEVELLPEGRP